MIKLQHPIANFKWQANISQMFGVNRNIYYPKFKLLGHNGLDYVDKYNTPILATHDGEVLQVILDNETHTKGNGIYLLSKDKTFYTIYWHLGNRWLNETGIVCKEGQEVKAGDIIGYMGNTGFVFPEPNENNIYNGTHLHFAVYVYSKANNDYKGMIDPAPYLFNEGEKLPIFFADNLYFGKVNNRVAWLQTCLKIEGFAQDYEPTGGYYLKTQRDVSVFQKKYNISPAYGFFGPITRTLVKGKYAFFV